MSSLLKHEHSITKDEAGLVFFTPNINIFRDPRWGRGQETPGEDPFLTSQYVYALITGLQVGMMNVTSNLLLIVSTMQRMIWNTGTMWIEFNLMPKLLTKIFLKRTYHLSNLVYVMPKVASIMCSYNAVNGIPSCANEFLLQTLARYDRTFFLFETLIVLTVENRTILDGFVVSDCDAVDTIISGHHYTSTPEDTVAVALHAGTDLDCGGYYQQHTQSALDNKKIVEADIDQALIRTFNVLVRLGYFDPPEQQRYRQLSKADVDTPDSRQLTPRSGATKYSSTEKS